LWFSKPDVLAMASTHRCFAFDARGCALSDPPQVLLQGALRGFHLPVFHVGTVIIPCTVVTRATRVEAQFFETRAPLWPVRSEAVVVEVPCLERAQ
jgi:hypothetical protein